MPQLTVTGRLERKDAGSPCFLRVPASLVASWRLSGTVEVQASLGGHELGRRALKRYDSGTWMVELANIHLRWAGLAAGDAAELTIRLPDPEPAPDPEPEPAPKPKKPRAPRKRAP